MSVGFSSTDKASEKSLPVLSYLFKGSKTYLKYGSDGTVLLRVSGLNKQGILCYLVSRWLDDGASPTSHGNKTPSKRARSVSWCALSCQLQVSRLLDSPSEACNLEILRGKVGQSSDVPGCLHPPGPRRLAVPAWSEALCLPTNHSLEEGEPRTLRFFPQRNKWRKHLAASSRQKLSELLWEQASCKPACLGARWTENVK